MQQVAKINIIKYLESLLIVIIFIIISSYDFPNLRPKSLYI